MHVQNIIKQNKLQDKITVVNKLSSDVTTPADMPVKATVLVSEILGTLMLGENALE